MSDLSKLRKLIDQQDAISENLGEVGIVSLRMPTMHERQMAWSAAHAKCGKANLVGCMLEATRHLACLCLSAWSVTPRTLLGNRAPEEGAEEVLEVSPEAAALFYDRFPEHYDTLSTKLKAAIEARENAQEVAEKNF